MCSYKHPTVHQDLALYSLQYLKHIISHDKTSEKIFNEAASVKTEPRCHIVFYYYTYENLFLQTPHPTTIFSPHSQTNVWIPFLWSEGQTKHTRNLLPVNNTFIFIASVNKLCISWTVHQKWLQNQAYIKIEKRCNLFDRTTSSFHLAHHELRSLMFKSVLHE